MDGKPLDDEPNKPGSTKSLEHAQNGEKAINPKINKKRRGYGNKNRRKNMVKNINLSIAGENAAGFTSKKESLFNLINLLNPSIITIQETKHKKMGILKLPGYQNFEKIRNGKAGGGLLTSVLEDLNPILISTTKDDIEILTVEASVGFGKIRIINGYGPQEDVDIICVLNFGQGLKWR